MGKPTFNNGRPIDDDDDDVVGDVDDFSSRSAKSRVRWMFGVKQDSAEEDDDGDDGHDDDDFECKISCKNSRLVGLSTSCRSWIGMVILCVIGSHL